MIDIVFYSLMAIIIVIQGIKINRLETKIERIQRLNRVEEVVDESE
jgi:Na+-transporting methylmalonyl-CoA/oxaloacetate decarboxylase beta subunit